MQFLHFLPSAQPWAPGILLPAQSLPSGTSALAGTNALYPRICWVTPLLPSSLCIHSMFWDGLHWIFHIIWYPLCVSCLQAHGSSQYCAPFTQYASVYTEHTGTHMYIYVHICANLINMYLCMPACGHMYRYIYTHIHVCYVHIWNMYRVCICVSTFSSRNDFCFLPPGGTRTCLGMFFWLATTILQGIGQSSSTGKAI